MNSVRSLAGPNPTAWLPVMQIETNQFFLALIMNKVEAEFQKNLQEIMDKEHSS